MFSGTSTTPVSIMEVTPSCSKYFTLSMEGVLQEDQTKGQYLQQSLHVGMDTSLLVGGSSTLIKLNWL